jgi:hypothetical protein
MTYTIKTQCTLVQGRMSSWHGCALPLGIVGGIF